MIAKLLTVSAIGLGVALEQGASSAAPAVADPAFNDLTCSCQTPAPPPPSQTSADRINQGLHDAFTR
ncbi:hypothetical protein [Mycobacterium sherrisii]|uniref:hypothetical protein n=1 Tax=Mycobacterium sherrisii TaxID=243061 RepID=UPI0012F492F7|nr:hypothetical protein [Mycobacterium sherrisii]